MESLKDITTGNDNTAVGERSGIGIETGSGNSIFGQDADGLASGLENNLILASGGVIRLQHDGVNTTTLQGNLVADKITASTGILFGTDTAAANTLDDYEEGTWTPTVNGDATGVIGTGTNGSYYTKTGNNVTIYMSFFVTTTFTANEVGGLPFQINHDGLASTQIPAGVVFGGDVNTVVGGLADSTASIGFYDNQDQTSEHAPNQTVGFYRLQFSYRTNQ
jgi:hypothetical protein